MKIDFVMERSRRNCCLTAKARGGAKSKEDYSEKEVLMFTHLCTRPVLNSGLR